MRTESSDYGQQHKITIIVDYYLNSTWRCLLALVKKTPTTKWHKFHASFRIQDSSNYNYPSVCGLDVPLSTIMESQLVSEQSCLKKCWHQQKINWKRLLRKNFSSSTPFDTFTLMCEFCLFRWCQIRLSFWKIAKKALPTSEIIALYEHWISLWSRFWCVCF